MIRQVRFSELLEQFSIIDAFKCKVVFSSKVSQMKSRYNQLEFIEENNNVEYKIESEVEQWR